MNVSAHHRFGKFRNAQGFRWPYCFNRNVTINFLTPLLSESQKGELLVEPSARPTLMNDFPALAESAGEIVRGNHLGLGKQRHGLHLSTLRIKDRNALRPDSCCALVSSPR